MRFYLGGPINGLTDEEAHGWRDAVKAVLAEHGHEWRDPMDRDYRGQELDPGIAAKIVRGDQVDIGYSDVLFMYSPQPSYGTAMEILIGYQRGKRVVVVLPEGAKPSPWVVHHANTIMYGSAVKAVRALMPGVAVFD